MDDHCNGKRHTVESQCKIGKRKLEADAGLDEDTVLNRHEMHPARRLKGKMPKHTERKEMDTGML